MKKALIDVENDNRVCQVVDDGYEFMVPEFLKWVECPDEVVADQWTYDGLEFEPKPVVTEEL
jgi:hypothetical protein